MWVKNLLMTSEIKRKLVRILDQVKDTDGGMSIAQMNLVAGIKQNRETKELKVYMYKLQPAKVCCVVFQMGADSATELLLKKEIEKEFPDSSVVFKSV